MFEYLVKLISFGLATLMSLPGPITIGQLLLAQPSEIQHIFATRQISASTLPQPYKNQLAPMGEQVPWKGTKISATDFLKQTKTQAFLAIHKGELVHEWYAEGVSATTTLPSYSVGKSMVSLLAGQAIEDGKLSEDATLVSVLPELKSGTDFEKITIRHLLDMQSGVDVPEEYSLPQGTTLMAVTTNLPEFIANHQTLRFDPGSKSDYRSVDTQLLGMAVARAEGQSLSVLLADRVWGPMGAQDNATWNLDHEAGLEKAFCCVNATARDFAKIGSLVLANGMNSYGQNVVSPSWVNRLRKPVGNKIDGWGYAAQWWHFGQGDFGAVGIHGQYIYVDPEREIVLVKLSNYGAEQDEKETIQAFRSISESLSNSRKQ